MEPLHHRVAQAAATDAYTELNRLITSLGPGDFYRPTRCSGWVVADLIFHLLLDARRALVAFSSTPKGEPDLDYVTYWLDHARTRTPAGADEHSRFVRVSASAYPEPKHLVYDWDVTARAVLQVIEFAPGARVIATQRHLMTITDLLSTLAVEAVIHHFDLLLDLPGKPIPRPGAIQHTAAVLSALLGNEAERPEWNDHTWILKATGREKLQGAEQGILAGNLDRFPLIG